MKKKCIMLLLFLCSLFSSYAVQTRTVSKDEALSAAKEEFEGKDVDYYLCNDKLTNFWYIFVDAEPMKGWEHRCYLLTIPKTVDVGLMGSIVKNKELMMLPPNRDFIPLEVKNRYVEKSNKPLVSKGNQTNEAKIAAQRTYAIILSGGVNKMSNYERYWNDCSFIYQTLVNKYEVPKGNIYPIMSDGNNLAADMHSITGGFLSQPLDLDNDGTEDIELSATKYNVKSTLSALAGNLQKDDHLFFFVIDHGGSDNGHSYINLWGTEKLYDYELADMLSPFTDRFVNVNVVLGQCFSGGFIDDLTKTGCVVATASAGNEFSWSCPDIPYDEFVYHWTCAVNEATHKSVPVSSDSDSNGRVTMEEAFKYAKLNDRYPNEHPQYVSTPISVGEDLAFNHLVPSVDLYIMDNLEDTGKEPNLTTDKLWISPSMWIRNQNDSIEGHENPIYTPNHQVSYVYVRVHNRGKEKHIQNKWLQIYWAQASTGLTAEAFRGREVYNGKYATGGAFEIAPIESISPGESRVVRANWLLPSLLEQYPDGNFHFCLIAKILDKPYDDPFIPGVTGFDVMGNNNIAQRNVTIIRQSELDKAFNVYVRNVSSSAKAYSLELVPRTSNDADLFSKANVELDMSPKIYSAWERGGFKSTDIELLSNNSGIEQSGLVRYISPQSKLENVSLNGSEFDVVKLKFDFHKYSSPNTTYTLDLIQKDENGNIIGGETFIVETPELIPSIDPGITIIPIEGGLNCLKVESPEFASVKWQNSKGETIARTDTVTVMPKYGDNSYTVIGMTGEGQVATKEVTLDPELGIRDVSVSGADNCILVELLSDAPANSTVSVASVLDGSTNFVSNVETGSQSVAITVPDIKPGIYAVNYMVGSEVVDTKKINIQ